MPWRLLALFLVAVLQPACLQIPDYNETGCGDSILGVGEDCDGRYALAGAECAAPGSEHACHYVCTDAACPEGWGCGVDGRCYQPQSLLVSPEGAEPVPIRVTDVMDVDGDGFGDLVDTSGLTISTRFSDGAGAFDSTFNLVIPPPSGTIWVAPLDEDAQSDAIIPLGPSLLVLSGQETRDFASRLFPTLVLPFDIQEAAGVALEADRDRSNPDSELLVLSQLASPEGSASVMTFLDSSCGEPDVALPDSYQVSDLGGKTISEAPFAGARRIPRADLDGDGFTEYALAFRGSRKLYLYGSAGSPGSTDPATCLRPVPYAPTPEIAVPDGFMLGDHNPLFVDLDGDTDLDVLVGVAVAADAPPDAPYDQPIPTAAFAVAQALVDGTYEAQATIVSGFEALPVQLRDVLAPLAAGDLDGDGFAEYVTPGGILHLDPPPAPGVPGQLSILAVSRGEPWVTAEVLDVNGDGALDVVAAAPGGLDWFLNATPAGLKGQLNRFVLDAPPGEPQLRSGDFNGDLRPDVAVVVRVDATHNELVVVFGSPTGVPGEVQSIGGFGGRVQFVETGLIPELGFGAVDGLSDLFLWTTTEPSEPDQPTDVAFYALQGSTSQRLLSPFFVVGEPGGEAGDSEVLVAAAGNFVDAVPGVSGAPTTQRSVAVVSLPAEARDPLAESGFTLLVTTTPGELRPAQPEPAPFLPLSTFHVGCALWLVGDVAPDETIPSDELIGIETSRCDPSKPALTMVVMSIDTGDLLPAFETIALPAEYDGVVAARLADVDDDDAPDLVLILVRKDDALQTDAVILWNDEGCPTSRFCGDSATLLSLSPPAAPLQPMDIVAMQLGGDERRELVVLSATPGDRQGGSALVAFAAAEDTPRDYRASELAAPLSGDRFTRYLAAGDVNGDGLDDLVLGGEPLASVFVQAPAEAEGTRLVTLSAEEVP